MEEEIDSIGELVSAYEAQLNLYMQLVEEVKYVLNNKLSGFSITGRSKDPHSLREKINRKRYKSLAQATDLAGVRVVYSYAGEFKEIDAIISAEFNVIDRVDKSDSLGIDKMGYRGVNYIVNLGHQYSGARYDGIRDLRCEIQVRTILEDAWARIEHGLVYKNKDAIPTRLQRDIRNVASLLEIAQRVFDTVREGREAYQQEIQEMESQPSDFLAQPVDLETIQAYTKWKYPDLPIKELIQSLLLRDIDLRKYPTLGHVNAAIEKARPAVEAYQRENPAWFQTGTDFITKSLGFVDEDFRKKHPFGRKTTDAFDNYGKSLRAK